MPKDAQRPTETTLILLLAIDQLQFYKHRVCNSQRLWLNYPWKEVKSQKNPDSNFIPGWQTGTILSSRSTSMGYAEPSPPAAMGDMIPRESGIWHRII